MIGTSAELFPQAPDLSISDNLHINEIAQNADGSSVYEIMDHDLDEPANEEIPSDTNFLANLAAELDENVLNGIAASLLDDIKQDLESRAEWEKTITLAMKYLGWQVREFRTVPFMYSSAAFDTTLSKALLRSFANCKAELMPATGPVRSQINGVSTPQTEDEGERAKLFLNYYLTKVDKEYYPDTEQMLMYLIFCGSCFRKVYIDPITKMPVARMIKPQDFIVNLDTASLLSSDRISQAIYLSKSDISKREAVGDFIEGTLSENSSDSDADDITTLQKEVKKIEGIDTAGNSKKSLFKYYECHVEWDASEIENGRFKPRDGERKIRPYIITLSEDTKKVAAIYRGWEEESQLYDKRHVFVHHYYYRGFGFYGIGLAHLAGSNAIALTSLGRQMIDKGTLNNFPGGLKQTGLKVENNDINIGPTEFKEVDTGGIPIQDCVMLMPYSPPSPELLTLTERVSNQTDELCGIGESQIPDLNSNAPVGTTMALLEVANKLQSTILRTLHYSFSTEFEYLKNLFAKTLPDTPYPFMVPGKDMAIMRTDFSDRINFSPVSDPNVLTSSHRLMNAEAQLKLAQSMPQIHNLKEAYRRMYAAMNVQDIDKLLTQDPQPQPLDAISENMLMMQGQPVTASLDQDHQAHNMLHEKFAHEMAQINPQAYAAAMIHIQTHKALAFVANNQEIQQQVPFEMLRQIPPQQFLSDMSIQNAITEEDAKAAFEQMQKAQSDMAKHEPVDPTTALMADIEQKREASHMKDEETKLKAEVESYKATLKHEAEMAKVKAQQEIAEDKNKVAMFIANMKNPHHTENIP